MREEKVRNLMDQGGMEMKLLKESKGFTLIEILIALVILSISLLGLAGLMVMTTKNNAWGSHMTEAATFAQDKLEEFKVTSWANIVSGADLKTGATGVNYTRTWTVVADGTNTLKTVTIALNWTDNISHSIQLLSVVVQ
jgi:prepilin-type N-terminal cleavage/methylation domain-containing protein